ncbi:rRNA maturation RNase YbeY [Asticcacaulis sp. AC402]|uniref:rRNA maturation RNase YbeY n=1 Tax=Asticcacaulis sp. AC402 TaxID=1282361 RepID=UPI0003C3B95A|nr:rRNA maturation RNase YbeY [Asticcacaulis sp. AC402]ESQ75898.1 hypothetical protein ABAC402_08000 [Asticcacaulis sp. AC402]
MEPLIDIEIDDDGWLDALPDAVAVVESGVSAALKAVDFKDQADVVVLLCDDAEMKRLNAEYRNKDKATNVLSFPAPKSMQIKGVLEHLGDMALGLQTCVREARDQGKTLKNHVLHLSVHGTLHLLGYDHIHDAEAETMENLERSILNGLGVADPYADGHA